MDDNSDQLKDLYATPESRTDTILDRGNAIFWRALRRALGELDLKDPEEVIKFTIEEFGVELELTRNEIGHEGFKPQARVVDEQKYLIFLLKHQN